MPKTEEKITEALKAVIDPHTGMSVQEMGLVHDLRVEGGNVTLTFMPTSPFCPLGVKLAYDIKKAVLAVEGVERVNITVEGHMNAREINEMLCKEE
jgi:metal-sulfur cluster biosynthetic enzyme